MNINCFDCLGKTAKIALGFWNLDNTKSTLVLDSQIEISKNSSNDCLKLSDSLLVTPIDREDIASLSLKLHKFNICSADFFLYKERCFPSLDLKKHTSVIAEICEKICIVIDNKLSDSIDKLCVTFPPLPEAAYENAFSTLGLIAKHTLFSKLEKCYFLASDIYDALICAVIKNA